MCIFDLLFIGLLTFPSASLTPAPPPGEFYHNEDTFPAYFDGGEKDDADDDYEANASEPPYDVRSATVTYDKKEYMGDVFKEYFNRQRPPPPTVRPSNSSSSQHMGGFGKIDISITYGCCANQKQSGGAGGKGKGQGETGTAKVSPKGFSPMTKQVGEISVTGKGYADDSNRFHYPPPNPMSYPGGEGMPNFDGYVPMLYQPPPSQEAAYMGYINTDEFKKYDDKQYSKQNNSDVKYETKRFYQQKDSNNNNKNNNNNYHYPSTTTTTSPRWQNYYTTQPPKMYTTSKRYNYRNYEEPQKTTAKSTTPMDRMSRNNTDYYSKPRFDSSPVLVAQEQFYTIENPSFLSTIPPVSPVTAMNRGIPVPGERSYFYTSERYLPPIGGYMPPTPPPLPSMQGPQGRYYQPNALEKPPGVALSSKEEIQASVSPPPGNMQSVTPGYSYYGNHVTPRSILQDISKIVIQDVPSRLVYNGDQQPPRQQRHQETYYPSQRSTTMSPNQPSPAPTSAPNQNYQQQNYQQPSNGFQRPQNNFQLNNQRRENYAQNPQNGYQNSFPIRKVYQPKPNTFQNNQLNQLSPNNNNFPQNQNGFRPNNFETVTNGYNPNSNNFNPNSNNNNPNFNPSNNNFDQNNDFNDSLPIAVTPPSLRKSTPTFLPGSNDPEDLIKKNRQNFLKMKRQAYDFFIKAALKDFRELLTKSIEDKNIEVLPEEKNMLDTKIEQTDEINSSILDYLTVYERYSDTLNNTELGNHILQDIDRAKEYLSMKLNKFWLELDAMESSDEFMEKKNYYKNREKPSGIMNIFYEWYEKLVTNPADINQEKIALHLVEIMKKERRYWLLLLRS